MCSVEVEAKFAVPDARSFQRLQAIDHLADFYLSQGQVVEVRDTYLDTAERAILASGYACRQRTQDGSALITLKGLRGAEGAVHRREELEVLLPSEQPPAHWPESPARDLVLQLAGDAPLIPLLGLEQTRVVRPISRGERPVAEFSLDQVRVVAGTREQTYLELEIELAPMGTEDDLCEIVNVLEEEWGLVAQPRSKFERALAFLEICPGASPLVRQEHAAGVEIAAPDDLHGKAKPTLAQLPRRPGLTAGDSMAEAARKVLRFHLQRMLYHEPGTRAGEDIEELHDMRVATRRMRAAIRVFLDYLDMDRMKPFVKGLRRTGRALGAVRDLDVFWEKTQKYLYALPRSKQGDLTPLHVVWLVEREGARKNMLAYLDSARYARFKERFGDFLQTAGAGALPVVSASGQPVPHRLRHVVPVAVYERLAAVRAYEEWLTGSDVPLERFHQLRIDAKGLRYALEFFQEVMAEEAKPLIEKIKSLQDHLGDLQDAVVASNLLRGFLAWGIWGYAQAKREAAAPHLRRVPLPSQPRDLVALEASRDSVASSIVAPGVASYLAARQAELQQLLETFPQAWAPIRSPRFSQQVASALATL